MSEWLTRCSRNRPLVAIAVGVAFAAGGVGGYGIRGLVAPEDPGRDHFPVREGRFHYTNPLLECEIARTALENQALTSFREAVERFIAERQRSGRVGRVAVYFRELNNGAWFSVTPEEYFVPASLLKVPVMMSLLLRAERDPGLLRQKLRFDGSNDLDGMQSVKPSSVLKPRKSYSVQDLIRRMIVYSDNNAAALLLKLLAPGELTNTYEDLGVSFHQSIGDESFISVESYASFFRILYNASYLDREMSEKALGYLADAEYGEGIKAGVPAEVPVAHKFGEWKLRESGSFLEQLHDCGIVYHSDRPYLLCVMTRGSDFASLDDVIAGISRIVYTNVDAQSRRP